MLEDENYITLQGWMRTQLELKGNELMVYALIYGFCQAKGEFTGSAGYIADWIGATKQTVFNTIKALIDKGLLEKKEQYNNGVKFCTYASVLPPVKNFDRGVVKKFDGGSQKFLPNNIDKNIYDKIIDTYNSICVSLPKCVKLTEQRKAHIKRRLAEYGMEELVIAFRKMEASDFATGRKGSWRASFDWIMKSSNNVAKVLEGTYDNNGNGSVHEKLRKAYEAIG